MIMLSSCSVVGFRSQITPIWCRTFLAPYIIYRQGGVGMGKVFQLVIVQLLYRIVLGGVNIDHRLRVLGFFLLIV